MFKKILEKTPGFRTGRIWKKIVAVIFYLIAFVALLISPGATFRDKLLFVAQFFIMFGIPFVLITNLGNIRNKLPLFRKKTVASTVWGILITTIIVLLGVSLFASFKSPEQKQVDLLANQQADQKAEAKKSAASLDGEIVLLGEIGNLTFDKADDVDRLRKVYESLPPESVPYVTKLGILESAEEKIYSFIKEGALSLNDRISAAGDIKTLSDDNVETVVSLRNEYNKLSEELKKYVTNLPTLETAEVKIATLQLQKAAEVKAEAEKKAKEAALAFDEKILGLGDIETLTLEDEDVVVSLKKEFTSLATEQKNYVTNIALLESAENKMSDLRAEIAFALDAKISKLGEITSLSDGNVEDAVALRKEFEALTNEQKALVKNLESLESAEKQITELKDKKAAEEKAAAAQKAAEEKAAAALKAAEEKAEEEYQNWVNSQFSFWDGSNTYLVDLIKDNLNDPRSFEHVETGYRDEGTHIIVKMTYRAKNAFGALILQNVTAKVDYVTQMISVISQND